MSFWCHLKTLFFFWQQSSNVLKFGDWEGQQDVPYTVYFEKAGKRKSGDKLKPNDTQYKPNMPHDYTPPVQAPPFQKEVKMKASKDMEPTGSKYEHHTEAGKVWRSEDPSLPHLGWKTAVASPQQYHVGARSGSSKPKVEATMGADASRRKYELDLSRQGVELRRPTDSPSRHENVGHRAAVDLNIQRNGGVNTGDKRSMHQITGSNNHRLHQITGSNNHSIDRSPLHPRYQAMVGGISSGVSSPSWEKQVSSESRHGLSPSNQRSHLGSVTQDSRKVTL